MSLLATIIQTVGETYVAAIYSTLDISNDPTYTTTKYETNDFTIFSTYHKANGPTNWYPIIHPFWPTNIHAFRSTDFIPQ